MNDKTRLHLTNYPLAMVSILGTTQLHLKNPWSIAWWSAAFPGFGHILLSKYLRGFSLIIWEFLINIKSHVNLAIMYSFQGNFDLAIQVIDKRWIILYAPVFVFGIYDSYRTAVDLNKIYIIASHKAEKLESAIPPFNIGALEINYLDRRNPWLSVVYSLLMPGMGQLYIHRIVSSFYLLAWWITVVYYSHLSEALIYSFLGDFEQAKKVVEPSWLLFVPSIYGFAIYDAYTNCVENNKLFDWNQSLLLRTAYQDASFKIPLSNEKEKGEHMYLFSTFEHSSYIEIAINSLQDIGIRKEQIFVVPLSKQKQKQKLFDSLHYSDGRSLFDGGAALGTVFMLFGLIYGFNWKWGPIIWALIGLLVGFSIGFFFDLLFSKRNIKNLKKGYSSEIVMVVQCEEDKVYKAENILWEHFAMGVSKVGQNT